MAKNKTSKFGVDRDLPFDTQNEEIKETTTRKVKENGAPKKKREGAYRFSLYIDEDLGDYVRFCKYKYHISITDFINELVRERMENDENYKRF